MSTTTELKPCPFCGGRAEFDEDDHGYHWINCTICSLATDTDRHDAEDCRVRLTAIWNRRSAAHGESKAGEWTDEQADILRRAADILEHDCNRPHNAKELRALLSSAPAQATTAKNAVVRFDSSAQADSAENKALFVELRESLRWALKRIEVSNLGQGELFRKADDVLARADAEESGADGDKVEIGCSNCGWEGKTDETRTVAPLGHPIAHHACPKCGKFCTVFHMTLEPLAGSAESERVKLSPDMKAKAEEARKELQRIKDDPQDGEERALKSEVLDGMSDPKCWHDDIVLFQLYGAQEFAKGYRAALSAQGQQSEDARDAARYRWLAARYTGCDFAWMEDEANGDPGKYVIVFNVGEQFPFDLSRNITPAIDAAMSTTPSEKEPK